MADINDLKNRTVSHGTLNPDHLIPAFCDVLKEYAPDKYAEFIKGYPELDDWEDFLEADWRIISDDTKMNASDDLFGLLNDIAPEGTMFSSTEGDGSDFGFWSVEEKKEESKDITTLTDLKKFILSKNDNSVVFGVNSTGDLYFVDSVNGKEVPASADSLAVAEDDSDEHGKRIGNQGTGYFVVWKNGKRPTYMTAQQIYDELLKIARSWTVEEKKSEADDDNKDLRIGLYYTEEELAILKDIFKKYVQEISGIRFSVPEDYTISYEISDDPLGDFEAVVKATGKKGKTIYLCNLHGEVLWAVNTPKQFWHYVGQVDPKTGEEKKDKYVIPPRSFFLDDEYYDNVKPSTRIPLLPSDWDKVDDYFKKFFKKRGEGFLDYDEGETALKQMAKGGKTTGQIAADIRYDVATALDMAADKAEDLMSKFGLDKIYVLRAKGLSPKAIAKRILKACESKSEAALRPWRTDFEKGLQKRIDDAKGTKYDTKDFTADGWEFVTGDVYNDGSEYGNNGKDVAVAFFKREQDGQYYRMWLAFDPDTKEITGGKWWIESDESKDERRDSADYLQEVWDALVSVWDKDKFNIVKGYDDEYECEAITIASKDNEGVRAKIYVDDHEGKHPVGFDVIYRYPGDKGVGDLGYYEFQSTDFDETAPEIFAYFDELKGKVGEAKGDNWVAYYFCEDPQGMEWAVLPHAINGIGNASCVNSRGGNDSIAIEYVLDECTPLEDVKGSDIYGKVKELEDRDIVALTRDEAERIALADDRLKELKAVVAPKDEAADRRRVDDYANMRFFDPEEFVKYVRKAYGKDGGYVSIDSVVPVSVLDKANRMAQANGYNKMESKNESLTLKQKELKDMARYGEAEDITTISDAEAKELKKKGIETVGVSRGTYGMNGALLRDREGNKYVITARSSNLFYFV